MVVVASKCMDRRLPDNTMHSCSQANVAFSPFNALSRSSSKPYTEQQLIWLNTAGGLHMLPAVCQLIGTNYMSQGDVQDNQKVMHALLWCSGKQFSTFSKVYCNTAIRCLA